MAREACTATGQVPERCSSYSILWYADSHVEVFVSLAQLYTSTVQSDIL